MTESIAASKTDRIRVLNDNFRSTFIGGRVLTTALVADLRLDVKARLFLAVQSFSAWSSANDPHGEHDFGAIELEGARYFFKVDYYSGEDVRPGSEDPSDPEKTTRVMTIMRADEY